MLEQFCFEFKNFSDFRLKVVSSVIQNPNSQQKHVMTHVKSKKNHHFSCLKAKI